MDGQSSLGRCYETGNGVDKTVTKALELFAKASKHGFAVAQFSLERAIEKQAGKTKTPGKR